MIECFIGTVGSGKTLSAVYECYQYYKQGYTVYTNIELKFPHTKLTKRVFDVLVKEKKGLQDAVIFIDEAHIWLDSRSSMMKKNKVITYFILQTRKRNVRMLVTTQHLGQVDKRLRDTIDILVFCRNMTNQTSLVKDASIPVYILQEYVFQWRDDMTPRKRSLYANPVFPLYDTSEIVDFTDDEEAT
jgi:hypothetical protein